MSKQVAVSLLLLVAGAAPLAAHDYWLQPDRFFLPAGEKTAVRLFVGDHFVGEAERPFQAANTVHFRLLSGDRARNLAEGAEDGAKPAGTLSPLGGGDHLVVMERDWSTIELEADKFNEYLKHEGLTDVLRMRRKAGEEDKPARERYRRYLKALVRVGGGGGDLHSRRVGHRLEIVLRSDPLAVKAGDPLPVQVFFDGKPLAGAQVAAYNRRGKETKTQTARTDDEGRFRFRLDGSGLWLIRLVHMRRCEKAEEEDWESFWAAYTFQVKKKP